VIEIQLQGIVLKNGKVSISDSIVSVCIKGHAQQSIRGNDVVCAGVSALSQSVAMALEYYTIVQSISQQAGKLEFAVDISSLNDIQRLQCESIISVFIIGINEIKKQYNEYIAIYSKE